MDSLGAKPTIKFNNNVNLIFSDVDETVADVYRPADPALIPELEKVLKEDRVIVFISGAGIANINERIVNSINPKLRHNILVAHCSGAEVWGYDKDGEVLPEPYYSLYDEKVNERQKQEFREAIGQLLKEFKLKTFPTMPKDEFKKESNSDPLSIMLADRGPQITFEMTNAYDLSPEQEHEIEIEVPLTHGSYDLRIPILERAEKLFNELELPITPRLAGTSSIDFAVAGVSKTTAVQWVLENADKLKGISLNKDDLSADSSLIEVWGDKYSTINGGTDRHICEGLPKQVRAIDFRQEDPDELPKGYNIQFWDGQKHLHHGLLEYLQSKSN